MSQQTSGDFDFDDWAGLYLENPAEFESRRQAVLMIEMTRGSAEHAATARTLLEAFEKAAKGRTAKQRMMIANNMMLESAHQLSAELKILMQALESLETTSPEPAS